MGEVRWAEVQNDGLKVGDRGSPRADALSAQGYDAQLALSRWLVIGTFLTLIVEPVLLAGVVVWAKHGRLDVRVFFALEEVSAALSAPWENPFRHASIVYISFLKGELPGQVYVYTIEALLFSATLGVLIGLNLAGWLVVSRLPRGPNKPERYQSGRAGLGGAVGAGSGGIGTVLGAAVGAAGCCGVSIGAGGLLTAFGLSYSTAVSFGARSEALQLIAIFILAVNFWYLSYLRARMASQR